jgi:membrane fusion protein (multidrug efflux system)
MAAIFRAKWLLIPIVLILIVAGYAAWRYFSKWESTDDAQVDGHIHPVNAKVGGTIMSVNVKENQYVDAGSVLAQLDARDYEIAVLRAQAELAQAQAAVLGARAGVPVASSAAGVQLTSAEAIAERAKSGVDAANKESAAAQARLNAA